MLRKCCFLLSILLSQIGFAQDVVHFPEYGKISIDELKMKECEFDHDAAAMVLARYESVEFIVNSYGDLKLVTQIVCRIKIFNETGYKSANIVIPYVGRNRTSKIVDVEGSTYNLENDKTTINDIDDKQIFKDKSAKRDGVSSVRFTFPNLKPGSVIEYRYTRVEKKTSFIAPWFFQDNIPTLFSGCKISFPALTHLDTKIIASLPVTEGHRQGKVKSDFWNTLEKSYVMRNIPSFKMEPFMSSLSDNLQRVEFSLIPSFGVMGMFAEDPVMEWHLINSNFLDAPFFGKQFDKILPGTDTFIHSLEHVSSISDKIHAVYNYVKTNISWDKQRTFYADDIADVWKEKVGNSAEINLILLDLLRELKVDCYPILISTRKNGKIDMDFASLSQFNGVDVVANDSDQFYILDATERHLSADIPPLNVLNSYALIIDPRNSQWVHISDSRMLLRDSVSVTGVINKDGLFKGEEVVTYFDLARSEKIRRDNEKEKEEDEDFLLSDAAGIRVDTSYKENSDDDSKPLREVVKFHYNLPSTPDYYFVNPLLFSTFRKNPFIDTTRRTGIDFGANSSFVLHMEITLPENISVEELTRNKIIRTPDTVFLFNRFNELTGNKLVVNSRFDINRSIFSQEEYKSIHDFFQNIYGILNQEVLLKRIN